MKTFKKILSYVCVFFAGIIAALVFVAVKTYRELNRFPAMHGIKKSLDMKAYDYRKYKKSQRKIEDDVKGKPWQKILDAAKKVGR